MSTSALKDLAYYRSLKYPILVEERLDGHFFVTHPSLDGCMAEGDSLVEATENLAHARELWIETRLSNDYSVPEPAEEESFSGRLSLRMDPELHAQLARIAERKDLSLNLLLNTVLASYAGGEDPLHAATNDIREALRGLAAPPPIISVVPSISHRRTWSVLGMEQGLGAWSGRRSNGEA